ncbi:MAG TPA: VWA domain-containing protein [Acidobacteriota bacterium]
MDSETAGNALQTYRARVERVLVDVSVQGNPERALQRDDFRLLVDGEPREIDYFGRNELPLAIALVIDCSQSTSPFLPEIKRATERFIESLKPQDTAALYVSTVPPLRLSSFQSDRRAVMQSLSELKPIGGSAILDALDTVVAEFTGAASENRRIILIVSDDIDTVSKTPDYRLSRKLLAEDIAVFEIKTASLMPFPMKLRSIGGKQVPLPAAARSAGDLVQRTGGKTISLRNRLNARWQGRSVAEGFEELRHVLARRYTIGFKPEPPTASFHPVRISLAKKLGKFELRYRKGYWD